MPRISSVIRPPVIAGGGGITATLEWVASDTLQQSADTVRYDISGTYTKKKEIEINEDVTNLRVKFDLKRGSGAGYSAYGRIYVNGIAVGTERNTSSTSYGTYTEDIAVSSGDLIQLYIRYSAVGSYPDYAAYCQNFRIYGSYSITEIDSEPLVTPVATTVGPLNTTVNQN